MWYQELLLFLLVKIKVEDREKTKQYLNKYVSQLKFFFENEKLPEQMLLGIIDKLYRQCSQYQNNSIPKGQFLQYLMALTIVQAKINNDLSIYTSDFLPFYDEALELGDRVQKFVNELIRGKKTYKHAKNSYVNSNRQKAIVIIFNELEYHLLKALSFNFSIDYDYIIKIFTLLNREELIDDFCTGVEDLENESPQFNEFLARLKSLHKKSKKIVPEKIKVIEDSKSSHDNLNLGSGILNHSKADSEQVFLTKFNYYKSKVAELEDMASTHPDFLSAAKAAKKLQDNIDTSYQSYSSKEKTVDSFLLFREASLLAIKEAHAELEYVRGSKQLLGGLALAVGSIGAIYASSDLMKKTLKCNSFYFKVNSEDKTDQKETNQPMTSPAV